MGFNVLNAAVSGVEGFLQSGGNPGAALAMGVAGGISPAGAATAAGNLGNGALGILNAQQEAFQVAMYGEQLRHQEQMQLQSQSFDEMMDQKAESMREVNSLRDVQMVQRKADNAITKKFIESITE